MTDQTESERKLAEVTRAIRQWQQATAPQAKMAAYANVERATEELAEYNRRNQQ